jgi:hypothetical protein
MFRDGVDASAWQLLERVLTALAEQLDASGPMTRERLGLGELNRSEMRLVAGVAGHLVHYDYGLDHPLARLLDAVTDAARQESIERGLVNKWLPGDRVYLNDGRWSRPHVVRFVGDDGTLDVQPYLLDDYVIETVPSESVHRASA